MNNTETIIKNKVSSRRNNLKNKLDGDDISTILRKQSRRRRNHGPEENETDAIICPSCGSTEFLFDDVRREKACKVCGVVVEENVIDSTIMGTSRDKEGNSLGQIGAPNNITIHDGGISTGFNPYDRNVKNKAKWKYLSRLHKQPVYWVLVIKTCLEHLVNWR